MFARGDGRALALLFGVWSVAVAGGGGRDERDQDLYLISLEHHSNF